MALEHTHEKTEENSDLKWNPPKEKKKKRNQRKKGQSVCHRCERDAAAAPETTDRPNEKWAKRNRKKDFHWRDTYIKSSSQKKNVFWSDRYFHWRVYLMFWWVRHISLNRLFSSSVCVFVFVLKSQYIFVRISPFPIHIWWCSNMRRLGHRRIAIKSKKKRFSCFSFHMMWYMQSIVKKCFG